MNANPSTTGSKTISAIDIIIAVKDTSIQASASIHVSAGVTIGANRVVAIVIDTDKATSPFAKYETTLDAVPPGQVPTKITPIANSGGKAKILTNA